jgi:hypothetical protein
MLCADTGLFDIFIQPNRFTPSHKTKTHAKTHTSATLTPDV